MFISKSSAWGLSEATTTSPVAATTSPVAAPVQEASLIVEEVVLCAFDASRRPAHAIGLASAWVCVEQP